MTEPSERPAGRLETLGQRVEDALLLILLAAMISIAAAQIVLRNLSGIETAWVQRVLETLNLSGGAFGWGDELLRLLVLWLALVAAVAASRADRHIRIDVLSRFLPKTAKRVVEFITDLFTAGVAGIIGYHAIFFVRDSREFQDMALGALPMWIFQLILPIGFGLISYRYVVTAIKRLRGEMREGP